MFSAAARVSGAHILVCIVRNIVAREQVCAFRAQAVLLVCVAQCGGLSQMHLRHVCFGIWA